MKKKASQNDLVLAYIRACGSITTLEAFQYLGITRLASRICDLSKMGYEFDRETIEGKNRFGDNVHFTKYTLAESLKSKSKEV